MDVASDIRNLPGTELGEAAGQTATDVASGASAEAPTSTFADLQRVKDFLNEQITKSGGWKAATPTEKNLALRDAWKSVEGQLESGTDAAAAATGDQEMLNKYLQDKLTYGNAKTAQNIALGSTSRDMAAQPVSLGSKALAAGELARGNLPGAAAAVGVNKVINSYGQNAVALGADKLADIVRGAPEKLGPFASMLSSALQRSNVSLGATNYILNQTNPAYREHMRALSGDQ
jgi:hypothetical protein